MNLSPFLVKSDEALEVGGCPIRRSGRRRRHHRCGGGSSGGNARNSRILIFIIIIIVVLVFIDRRGSDYVSGGVYRQDCLMMLRIKLILLRTILLTIFSLFWKKEEKEEGRKRTSAPSGPSTTISNCVSPPSLFGREDINVSNCRWKFIVASEFSLRRGRWRGR